MTDGRVEHVCLHLTVGAPIFAILVTLAAQSGWLVMPMRELTLIAMGVAGLWCICIPRLPTFSHLILFAVAILFSGLAYGLDHRELTDFAPLLLVGPQVLLLAASVRFAAQRVRRTA